MVAQAFKQDILKMQTNDAILKHLATLNQR